MLWYYKASVVFIAVVVAAASGAAGDRQDGDVGDDRVPAGASERRARLRVRAVQHRRRPADGEDTQDGPEGGASVREEPRGDRLARLVPRAAQPDPGDGEVRASGGGRAGGVEGGGGVLKGILESRGLYIGCCPPSRCCVSLVSPCVARHHVPVCVLSHPRASYHIPVRPITSPCVLSHPRASYYIPVRPITSPCASYHIPVRPITSLCVLSRPRVRPITSPCVLSHPRASYHIPVRPITSPCVLLHPCASYHVPVCVLSHPRASYHIPVRPITSPCVLSHPPVRPVAAACQNYKSCSSWRTRRGSCRLRTRSATGRWRNSARRSCCR